MKYDKLLAALLENEQGTKLQLTTDHEPQKAVWALSSGLRRALEFHNAAMDIIGEDELTITFVITVNPQTTSNPSSHTISVSYKPTARIPFSFVGTVPPTDSKD